MATLQQHLEAICRQLEADLGTGTSVAEPLLSPVALSSILEVCDGDHGFLLELVGDYLGELPRALEQMGAGLLAGTLEQVRIAAHTLKGSSGSLGLLRLVEACRRLEAAARAGELETSRKAYGGVRQEARHARVALQALRQPLEQAA